jgi:hypothetical protein
MGWLQPGSALQAGKVLAISIDWLFLPKLLVPPWHADSTQHHPHVRTNSLRCENAPTGCSTLLPHVML